MSTPNFDRVAAFYDSLAQMVFGGVIKRSQTYYLNKIKPEDHVLVIGGGTGWVVKEIIKKANPSQITFVEASKKMLTIAQRKVQDERVHWVQGTQDSIPSNVTYDVIFTAYFLDVFTTTELPNVVSKLEEHLKKGGLWLFTDFVKSHWLVKTAYAFFRITTGLKNQQLPDYDKALKDFTLQEKQSFYKTLISSRVYLNR